MLIAYYQILRGYIAVADTVKSEAKVAVQELKRHGFTYGNDYR